MDTWLTQARAALAAEAELDPATLELTDAEVDSLLDLARIAAHDSGERTNAPLLCYLVGRAQGSRALDQLVDALRRSTS